MPEPLKVTVLPLWDQEADVDFCGDIVKEQVGAVVAVVVVGAAVVAAMVVVVIVVVVVAMALVVVAGAECM